MKAIHNQYTITPFLFTAVFNISKIQNESNSQLCWVVIFAGNCCVQYIKDTK